MPIRYQKLSFTCSFLYFPLICNAHQAHIRFQTFQFSCSFLYISLISNAQQIPKTFIVVRDRKDPEVQQAIVLVVMVDMVNVVKRLSTILELQERYVAHSPQATECPPEDPVYVDAHAAHQISKIKIFMQFFICFLNFQCSIDIKMFIFMQFFVFSFNFQCTSDPKNYNFHAVVYIFL